MKKKENIAPATVEQLWQERKNGRPVASIIGGVQQKTRQSYANATVADIHMVKQEIGEMERKARIILKANPDLKARYRFELGLYAAQRVILDAIIAARMALPAGDDAHERDLPEEARDIVITDRAREWAAKMRGAKLTSKDRKRLDHLYGILIEDDNPIIPTEIQQVWEAIETREYDTSHHLKQFESKKGETIRGTFRRIRQRCDLPNFTLENIDDLAIAAGLFLGKVDNGGF